jgi:hypothetical protein
MSPRVLEDSLHPRLHSGASARPLNFFVRRIRAMSRGTTIALVAIVAFGLGALSSFAYDRLYVLPVAFKSRFFQGLVDEATFNRMAMNLIASNHTDTFYDIAESGSLICVLSDKMPDITQQTRKNIDNCMESLRLFYQAHPDRVPHLLQQHPREAKLLGFSGE